MQQKIREEIKRKGLHQWQVAAEAGISESTLIRWLRGPITSDKKGRIMEAIKRLAVNGEKGETVNVADH